MDLVRTPGAHLVPGGPELHGYKAVYMVRVDDTVLVYCPEHLRPAALDVLADTSVDDVFTARTCERMAGGRLDGIRGPVWHGFADDGHFRPVVRLRGQRVSRDDGRLAELQRLCGEDAWNEAGFAGDEGVLYGVDIDGQFVAAGNMTSFRGVPSDVGLITHPDHRGRGLAKALASRMIGDALPAAGVVRYRTTNAASFAVGRALGFVGRGENLMARLPDECS